MSSNKLMRFLTTPKKLAAVLDWKKVGGSTILAIDIGREKVGMAVAPHPSTSESIEQLAAVSLKFETKQGNKRRSLAPDFVDELQCIVRERNVCGFLVSWPIQKEGRCGAPCGRVLHTLDSLVTESSSILTASRPFCLWDGNHVLAPEEDNWGRSRLYGQPPTSKITMHIASLEQYRHDCSSKVAADNWHDFCRIHWPKIHQKNYQANMDDEHQLKNERALLLCESDKYDNEWFG